MTDDRSLQPGDRVRTPFGNEYRVLMFDDELSQWIIATDVGGVLARKRHQLTYLPPEPPSVDALIDGWAGAISPTALDGEHLTGPAVEVLVAAHDRLRALPAPEPDPEPAEPELPEVGRRIDVIDESECVASQDALVLATESDDVVSVDGTRIHRSMFTTSAGWSWRYSTPNPEPADDGRVAVWLDRSDVEWWADYCERNPEHAGLLYEILGRACRDALEGDDHVVTTTRQLNDPRADQ